MKITSQFIEELTEKVESVLKETGDEMGVSLSIDPIRYYPDRFHFKVKGCFKETDDHGEEITPEGKDFHAYADRYGLSPDDLHKTFNTPQGETFKITGLNRRAHKYPIQVKRESDNALFKMPVYMVALYLKEEQKDSV